MNKRTTIREATEDWIGAFNFVPSSVIEKMVEADEDMSYYDSDSLRLVASPRIACGDCGANYEGELSLAQLEATDEDGKGIACEYCSDDTGDHWMMGDPEYAYPCGWGTLFAPKDQLDIEWILDHKDEIAELRLFRLRQRRVGVPARHRRRRLRLLRNVLDSALSATWPSVAHDRIGAVRTWHLRPYRDPRCDAARVGTLARC